MEEDLSELFHAGGLDIQNVEGAVRDVQMPEIDAQVIRTEKGLLVARHADAVDVVRVSICVRSTAFCSRLHIPANHLQSSCLSKPMHKSGTRCST